MTQEQIIEEKIDELLADFNFDKVHKVMEFLDWKWANKNGYLEVPSTYDIIKSARELLKDLLEKGEPTSIETKGFKVTLSEDGYVEIMFILENKDIELSSEE